MESLDSVEALDSVEMLDTVEQALDNVEVMDSIEQTLDNIEPLDTDEAVDSVESLDTVDVVPDSVEMVPDSVESLCPRCGTFHAGGIIGEACFQARRHTRRCARCGLLHEDYDLPVWGYGPRYPQDKTWAAPSEVARPTRSRRARRCSACTARYCIVPNRLLYL